MAGHHLRGLVMSLQVCLLCLHSLVAVRSLPGIDASPDHPQRSRLPEGKIREERSYLSTVACCYKAVLRQHTTNVDLYSIHNCLLCKNSWKMSPMVKDNEKHNI